MKKLQSLLNRKVRRISLINIKKDLKRCKIMKLDSKWQKLKWQKFRSVFCMEILSTWVKMMNIIFHIVTSHKKVHLKCPTWCFLAKVLSLHQLRWFIDSYANAWTFHPTFFSTAAKWRETTWPKCKIHSKNGRDLLHILSKSDTFWVSSGWLPCRYWLWVLEIDSPLFASSQNQ